MKLRRIILSACVVLASVLMLGSCVPQYIGEGYPPLVAFDGRGGTMTVKCTSAYDWYISNRPGSNTILLENKEDTVKMRNGWLTITVCEGGATLILTAESYEKETSYYQEPIRSMEIQALNRYNVEKITVKQKLL